MRDKSLLENLKNYKNTMVGKDHSLFRGLMVCKVTGVTYDNRQEILKDVKQDTPVRLVRDRQNEFDFHAVIVQACIDFPAEGIHWHDVGFVPSNINKDIAQALDAGVKLEAKVWRKTGGEQGFHHGLSITIKRKD